MWTLYDADGPQRAGLSDTEIRSLLLANEADAAGRGDPSPSTYGQSDDGAQLHVTVSWELTPSQ
jgi:hypothetical protein